MKQLKSLLSILGALALCNLTAQVNPQVDAMHPADGGIASETTVKTYKLVKNDEVIRNSVKINTTTSEELLLDKSDKGMVNQDQKIPKKTIVKTIKIDNDGDDAYDEMIKFRYRANTTSDFVLVTNDDQIMVALDDGDNLRILEDQSFSKEDVANGSESYVFTDKNGKEVNFFIDDYESLKNTASN